MNSYKVNNVVSNHSQTKAIYAQKLRVEKSVQIICCEAAIAKPPWNEGEVLEENPVKFCPVLLPVSVHRPSGQLSNYTNTFYLFMKF